MELKDGNSILAKREKEQENANKPTKVITGKVVEKKPGFGKKVSNFFQADTGIDILDNVIVPGLIDFLYDIGLSGLSQILYHDAGKVKRKKSGSSFERTDYAGKSKKDRERPRNRGMFDLEEYFETQFDAQQVLSAMKERINNFDVTTVSDYYDFIGKTAPGNYLVADWGWYDLDGTVVRHSRDGWYIDLPKPRRLD